MYNKSYNDFYNNNKKKIRINFKPIEENAFDDLNFSKKVDIGKVNSNQKIKKISSKATNIKRKNKARHYKSRSLMDIDNPINIKNHPKKETIPHKENNMTINDNQKIPKVKSTKCASMQVIGKNNNTVKPKKPLLNISFLNLHTNENRLQNIEPKRYKGPIDLNCLLITKSLYLLIEKISNLLKRYKITNIFINPYKLRCSKNGQSFNLEFMKLNDNLIKINNINNNVEFSYENDSKFKTITENDNRLSNLYYYSISSKLCKNKNLIMFVSKLISSKFGPNQNKR